MNYNISYLRQWAYELRQRLVSVLRFRNDYTDEETPPVHARIYYQGALLRKAKNYMVFYNTYTWNSPDRSVGIEAGWSYDDTESNTFSTLQTALEWLDSNGQIPAQERNKML